MRLRFVPGPPSPMLLVLAAAAALLGAGGCRNEAAADSSKRSQDGEPAGRVVRVALAERGTLPQSVLTSGTLAAEERADLAMKAAGRIGTLHVDLGSVVAEGAPLARLDPTDFDLRVSQSEAALRQAQARLGLGPEGTEADVTIEDTAVVRQAKAVLDEARLRRDRFLALHRQELVSAAERDAAEASFLVAESRYQDALEEARNRRAVLGQRRSEYEIALQQRADSVLLAPFAGAISARHVAIGQYVTPGQPVVTIVRTHPLRLRVEVPEREAARVRKGQEVIVTVEGESGIAAGRVARLSPALDERSRTLTVEAEIPNRDGRLRPGSFARAEIITASDVPAVLVPRAALTTFAGIEKVLLVVDGKSEERRVVSGRRASDRVEIVEGLLGGETVVVDPGNLVGGQAVEIER